MSVPRIDHLVVDTGPDLDAAAARYTALGFQLTKRAHHSLGSSNHLAMFDPDYLELLCPGNGARQDLVGFANGMNGLVFDMQDAEGLHAAQTARGVPVQPVQYFTRNADLPDGTVATARFHTVRLPPRIVFDGRVYFCEHLTPEFVWRPEWLVHPNGALHISRVAIAAENPDRLAETFDRMFGDGAVARAAVPGTPHILIAGRVAVQIWPRATLADAIGPAMPDPAGRADHIALFGLRVRSLPATADLLRANGVRLAHADASRLVVSPADAVNVAIEFSA